jgi:carbonic anhydrase
MAGSASLLMSTMGVSSISSVMAASDITPKPENVLTPDAALARLMAGNKRYVEGQMVKNGSFKNQPVALKQGQNPYACILSCADSRVGPELCFDEGQGDLFVTRLAGNYASVDMLASLEYGALMLKAPLIMVLGHTECGAINAAIKAEKDDVDFPGHIQVISSTLDHAVRVGKEKGGNLSTEVAKENVRMNVLELQKSTPILRRLVQTNKLKIVGGIYDLETGIVSLVN